MPDLKKQAQENDFRKKNRKKNTFVFLFYKQIIRIKNMGYNGQIVSLAHFWVHVKLLDIFDFDCHRK